MKRAAGAAFTVLIIALAAILPAGAQDAEIFMRGQVKHRFGESITFIAQITAPAPIEEVSLFLEGPQFEEEAAPSFAPTSATTATYTLDAADYVLTPFARISYHWEIADEDGNTFLSEPATFIYSDNRFAWESRTEGPFTVYTYDRDADFAGRVLEVAQAAAARLSEQLEVEIPDEIAFYLYNSTADFEAGIPYAPHLSAYAVPSGRAILINLYEGPDEEVRLQQLLPHELTHLFINEVVGSGRLRVPAWLGEGYAVYNEAEPDPYFHEVFREAYESGDLQPLDALCAPFPDNMSMLGYAQSYEIVRFIINRWGTGAILDMLRAYSRAASCEGGVQQVLALSLKELEREWLSTLQEEQPAPPQTESITGWLIALGVVFVLTLPFFGLLRRRR